MFHHEVHRLIVAERGLLVVAQQTELAGRKIIELARAGEHDADRLTARVLAEFGIENDGSLWRH